MKLNKRLSYFICEISMLMNDECVHHIYTLEKQEVTDEHLWVSNQNTQVNLNKYNINSSVL